MSEESTKEADAGKELVTEMCDQGHKFSKLPDHPKKDGLARCPHCMAIGIDALRSAAPERVTVPREPTEASFLALMRHAVGAKNYAEELDRLRRQVAELERNLVRTLLRAEKAEAENAALREDAERYRWLRECNQLMVCNVVGLPKEWYAGTALDSAIDAVRRKND